MTDYADPAAVLQAVKEIARPLMDSGRAFPQWFNAAVELVAAEGMAATLRGHDRSTVGRWMATTYLLMGILAEREGWPLVGDLPAAEE